MSRFIKGKNRYQCTLLPELLDNYIAVDNSARVIETFVDELDLFVLGFTRVQPRLTSRLKTKLDSHSMKLFEWLSL